MVNPAIAAYISSMRLVLLILLGLDMLAVLAVMLSGVFGMASPAHSPQASNRLMQLRVTLQGVAVALIVALMLTN